MRGKNTDPKMAEEAKALVAQTNNKSLVSRLLSLPRETIRDLVLNDDEFAEFRHDVQKEYIVKTWGNILEIETALAKQLANGNQDKLAITELTRVLKDLKSTVESVTQNILNINQINTVSAEQEKEDRVEFGLLMRLKEKVLAKFGSLENAVEEL